MIGSRSSISLFDWANKLLHLDEVIDRTLLFAIVALDRLLFHPLANFNLSGNSEGRQLLESFHFRLPL